MMYMNAKMRSALFDPTCPKAGRSLGTNVLIRLANCSMLTRVARELTFRHLNSKDVARGAGHESPRSQVSARLLDQLKCHSIDQEQRCAGGSGGQRR
jgi:hypothetical protein